MYVSPLAERIRKRKAFADTELESSSHLFVSSSPPTMPFSINSSSTLNNLLPPYSTMPTMSNVPLAMHLGGVIDYSTTSQMLNIPHENDIQCDLSLSPSSSPQIMDKYRLNADTLSTQHIRIIDDAKLFDKNVDQMNNESFYYAQSSMNTVDDIVNEKPKLSFSIESIIGIK